MRENPVQNIQIAEAQENDEKDSKDSEGLLKLENSK